MSVFAYRDARLHAEDVDLSGVAARHGTPCYVYSRSEIESRWRAYDEAFAGHPHLVCYAVKANSNIAVLNVLARLGSGFDIVSVGELERVLRAGGDPRKVVFAGVGKRADEMVRALEAGIRCFNVESEAELERLDEVARRLGRRAPVSLRVNPDVDARTHPYISTGLKENKFGIPMQRAVEICERAAGMRGLELLGVGCHIGSQLTETAPFRDALDRLLELLDRLAARGVAVRHLDLGGGLGIRYRDETPPSCEAYAAVILAGLRERDLEIVLEPGRSIVGNGGVLLTRVEYLKNGEDRRFAIVDAAMNDLIRPSLYGAWQDIVPVTPREDVEALAYDVVGPVCETGDFLGKSRLLAIQAGDVLAVKSAGAYGFVMSSNYNSRPRPPELMVDGGSVHVVRAREPLEGLMDGETLLP